MTDHPGGLLSLLEKHGAELHALFTRLTLRTGIAEDLMQDLFLKLRKADGLSRAANPRAYLFRAAMHLAFDWRRAQRPTEAVRHEPVTPAESPLEGLIHAEMLEQVLDAMTALSELTRQAVVLRYLQQANYPAIAEQLGKTEHQAQAVSRRGLEQLGNVLRPMGQGPTKPELKP